MKKLIFASIAALTASLAHADSLVGSHVTVTVDFPTFGTPVSVPTTATVGSGVEFPDGSLVGTTSTHIIGLSTDVGANSIDFQWTENYQLTPATFNGYLFDFDGSSPDLTSVTIDPLTNINNSLVNLAFSDHELSVNLESLVVNPGSRLLLDVNTASVGPVSPATAPEPQSAGFAIAGFAGMLIYAGRKRFRKA